MFQIPNNRRFDRSLSRKLQELLVNDQDNVTQQLSNEIISRILKIKNDPIDVHSYTAIQLIKAEYLVNKFLLETILLHTTSDSAISIRLPKYSLEINDLIIEIESKPSHGHVGQCLLTCKQTQYGMPYESTLPYTEILIFFSAITQGDAEKEKAIGKMMLAFIKKGAYFWDDPMEGIPENPINATDEQVYLTYSHADEDGTNDFIVIIAHGTQIDLSLTRDQHEKFLAICYLVCVKEVTRRLASEQYYVKKMAHVGKDLPFLSALFRGLLLLVDGTIRINQLFSPDSQYGVSTGENITIFGPDNLKKTKNKFNALNEQFIINKFDAQVDLTHNFTSFFNRFGFNYVMPGFNQEHIKSIDKWSDDDADGRPPAPVNF